MTITKELLQRELQQCEKHEKTATRAGDKHGATYYYGQCVMLKRLLSTLALEELNDRHTA